MKLLRRPPRPIIHMGLWYIKYYLPGKRDAEKIPVGYPADIEAPVASPGKKRPDDWWRKSSYAKHIEAAIIRAEDNRRGIMAGRPADTSKFIKLLTWDELLAQFQLSWEHQNGTMPKSSIRKRKDAVKLLRAFDPKIQPHTINDKWTGRWRKWVETIEGSTGLPQVSASTLQGYVQRLRGLMEYAVKKGYAKENPFEGMTIKVPKQRVRQFDTETVIRSLKEVERRNERGYLQLVFLATHGYRVIESGRLQLYETDFKRKVFDTDRVKMERDDVYPFHTMTYSIFRRLEGVNTKLADLEGKTQSQIRKLDISEKHLFHYRGNSALNEILIEACDALGEDRITSRHMKKVYAQIVTPYCGRDADLKNLMLHHIPSGMNKVAINHYTGPMIELMRETAEAAFGPLVGSLLSD